MPMKVIVCFDEVRVTVPCGDGDIPVSELITKAVHRYKRATGKGGADGVTVSSLKTISGGGILDPDDLLNDVVDDREQLIAEFDEPGRVRIPPPSHPHPLHNGGDGGTASSYSTGTLSPELFQSGDVTNANVITIPPFVPPRRKHRNSSSSASSSTNNTNAGAATDVVVTPRDLTLGSNLRVRRGSDPGLNILDTLVKEASSNKPVAPLRPSITRRESVRESDDPKSESSEDEKKMKMAAYGSLDRKRFSHKFTRDLTRASLSNRPEMARWMEAQGRRLDIVAAQKLDSGNDFDEMQDMKLAQDDSRSQVTIPNDGGPLGIHAVPAYDGGNHAMGLLIQSVEPGRPVDRDGRIQPNDIVVEINGIDLYDVPFLRAQDIFRSAMQSFEINLSVIKSRPPSTSPSSPTTETLPATLPFPKAKRQAAAPPPVMPKPRNHIPNKPSPLTLPSSQRLASTDSNPTPDQHKTEDTSSLLSRQQQQQDSSRSASPVIQHHHQSSHNSSSSSCSNGDNRIAPLSTFSSKPQPNGMTALSAGTNTVIKPGPPIRPKKTPAPVVPSRNPKTALSSSHSNSPEAPININALTNTRRIGKRISMQLKKGPLGLGFSVTSRDNQTDGECPIYIRNILPKGAAIQDGRLRIGDRLLEVNGVEMTGKNQAEAVALLRRLPEGSVVDLVVSRQEEVDERFKVPRQLETNGKTSEEIVKDEVDVKPVVTGIEDMVVNEAIDLDDTDALSNPQPTTSVNNLDSPPGFTKEKITLCIPLNDTGSAGLGVSVKGKTQTKDSGEVEDLGIFVKTVLQGGAASKNGKLLVNDQLLDINGINLIGLTNTAAMETLRAAMMDDSQIPGIISLSVARHSGGSRSPSFFPYRDSPLASPGSTDTAGTTHSKASNIGNSIFHQRSSSTNESSLNASIYTDIDLPSPIPPVRSKRVGQLRDKFNELNNAVRNESYTRATHESLNDSSAFTNIMPPSPNNAPQPLKQSNSMSEYDDQDVYAVSSKMQRPHSTIGFLHGPKVSQSSVSDDEAFKRASTASSKDDSDLSPQGDPILPFAREGFGRQSMSEKRKGHIDPRSTEVYKQAKANKENKGGFLNRRVRSFHVTGNFGAHSKGASGPKSISPNPIRNPSSQAQSSTRGPKSETSSNVHDSTYQPSNQPSHNAAALHMKKSSSVEDLSNTVKPSKSAAIPIQSSSSSQQNNESSAAGRTNRFGRARACNDSFRAAVDRSYDVLDPALMDTLEEESLESSAFMQDRSSISSENTQDDFNSLKRQKGKDKEKKGGGGLLKGFLRFGKGRKSNEEALRRSRSEERSAQKNNNHQVSRRAEHSMDRAANSRSKNQWGEEEEESRVLLEHRFYPVNTDSIQVQPKHNTWGRRASQQETERIEEEYARLRDNHVTEQRLRSQSVDPSAGRGSGGVMVIHPDRISPFQPYVGVGQQQHQQQMTGNHNSNFPDPRLFHPAAVAQGPPESGYGMRAGENRSHHTRQGSQESIDSRTKIAKAVMSRAEKIQQLRTMYQQKHQKNQGVYPLDDTEEEYEQQIQQLEQRWATGRAPSESDRPGMESPLAFERNGQGERGHPPVRPYGSSPSVNNLPGSMAAPYNHQLQYTNSNSSSSSSNRQPRSRPHSRGATGRNYPGVGGGGGGKTSPYHHQDNTPPDSHYYHSHHQQHPSHHQQHQQSPYHPPLSQHHSLPHPPPHPHSSYVNSSQEEITSFSGYQYDYDSHRHNNNNQHHSMPTGYHPETDNSGGGGRHHQFGSSPSHEYFSSSLQYPPHHHYHQTNSTHPDSAKV